MKFMLICSLNRDDILNVECKWIPGIFVLNFELLQFWISSENTEKDRKFLENVRFYVINGRLNL